MVEEVVNGERIAATVEELHKLERLEIVRNLTHEKCSHLGAQCGGIQSVI